MLALLLPAIALIAITPAVYGNNGVGAMHINLQDSCSMIDPTNVPNTTLTGSLKDVLTPSGIEHIVCKATVPGYDGPAVHFDSSNTGGIECSSNYGALTSTDWHEEVSASGNVTFTCEITGVSP